MRSVSAPALLKWRWEEEEEALKRNWGRRRLKAGSAVSSLGKTLSRMEGGGRRWIVDSRVLDLFGPKHLKKSLKQL